MNDEFDFIQYIKKRHGLKHVGDDCAVLPKDDETDLVISTDMLVENIDFRTEWAEPEDIGHKSLAVSLSDIAAMGATPKWAMLSVGAPKDFWRSGRAERFFEGYMRLAEKFSVELIGGDISTADSITIDSIAAGEVPHGKAIFRGGARPGDSIFIAGTLGGAAAGLKLLEYRGGRTGSNKAKSELIQKQLRPMPQIDLGAELGGDEPIATAMIDVSDGLSSDLRHICNASGVGAIIYAGLLPIDPNLESFAADERLRFALSGGEDLGLLFTTDSKNDAAAEHLKARKIGKIEPERDIRIVIEGTEHSLEPEGFRHF